MTDIDARLREDVHLLGELLGNTIREQYGEGFLDKIEQIRKSAKADRRGAVDAQLSATLGQLSEDELLPVARAFNQFLNLANIAEQYQLIHRRDDSQPAPFEDRVLPELLARLLAEGHGAEALARQLGRLDIELVLTAHPTEVARRTLIQKYDAIASQLAAQDHRDLTRAEREQIHQRLQRLIAEAWYTEEIRRTRPTPVDEAKWGFAVIEHSLWHAIPKQSRPGSVRRHGPAFTPRGGADPFRLVDGRRPRRQPQRHGTGDPRSAVTGALDGGGFVPARHRTPGRRVVHAAGQR